MPIVAFAHHSGALAKARDLFPGRQANCADGFVGLEQPHGAARAAMNVIMAFYSIG